MTTYEDWRGQNHPIAALASNVTEHLLSQGPTTFNDLAGAFGDEKHQSAKPSEIAEALALAFAVRQVEPKDDRWQATPIKPSPNAALLDPLAPTPNQLTPHAEDEPPTGVQSPQAKRPPRGPVALHEDDPIFAGQNLRKA